MQIVLDTGLVQVVGIMPTLILAQVGLGRTTQDVEANFRMTHIEMDTIGDATVDTSGKRSDVVLRWQVANGLPSSSDHDRHHYLHFTGERGRLNDQPYRSKSEKSEPECVELEDNQRFEVDVVNGNHQIERAQPHLVKLTPNRPTF